MPAYGNWRRSPQASEHGDGLEPTARTAAAVKHLQPGTARSGRNASVTILATLASSEHGDGPHRSRRRRQRLQQKRQRIEAGNARVERARRRPIRADDEGSGCSKALAALHRAQRTATAHQSRRQRQRLQQSGRNASVTRLATLASSEHGYGPSEPTTKAAAAAKHLHSPAPRTAVETPA
eukprot:scaffold2445_cov41-Phaeocystis_antarctica.AAC.2